MKLLVGKRIRSPWKTAARFANSGGRGGGFFVSGDDLRPFFPPHLSNNANVKPRPTMEFHLHLWTTVCGERMAARVVMLHGVSATGKANARDGQRRSLKIESICALGLEIQIRREISMVARAPGSLSLSPPSYI